MTFETIPVKPDPHTGLPRPSHAPRGSTNTTRTRRPLGKIRHPFPPEEIWGPPLEWDVGSRRDGWKGALFTVIAFGAFIGFKLVTSGEPLRHNLVFIIFTGGIMGLLAYSVYLLGSRRWLVAGALWLQKDDAWVSLYELTDVTVGAGGGGQTCALTDRSGHVLYDLKLWPIQNHQLLWDLIYNGMLYSIYSGTLRPAASAQRMLSLPEAPPTPAGRAGGVDAASDVPGDPVPDRDAPAEENRKRRGAVAWIVFFGVLTVFFGFCGAALVATPETHGGGVFLVCLALALAVVTWVTFYLRYDRGPLSKTKNGSVRQFPPPAVVALGLLLAAGGAFVFADNALVGFVLVALGVVTALWQLQISIKKCLSAAATGHGGIVDWGRHQR